MTSALCPLLWSSSLSPVTELGFLQTPHSLYGWRTAQRAQLWGAGADEGAAAASSVSLPGHQAGKWIVGPHIGEGVQS